VKSHLKTLYEKLGVSDRAPPVAEGNAGRGLLDVDAQSVGGTPRSRADALVERRPARERPALALVEAPRPRLAAGREQPHAVKPRARASSMRRGVQLARQAGAPVPARDEELAEVHQARVVDRREGALGGQEADVADELAVVLGDEVPDVVVAEQRQQALALAGGRRRRPALRARTDR
jgi:hypothetical protein